MSCYNAGVYPRHFYLLFLLTLFVFGSLLFLGGFFLTSQHLPEATKHDGNLDEKWSSMSEHNPRKPPLQHQQFILMIIDALRLDFVTSDNMPFAYKHCCKQVNLKVDLPTVTLPRLKSIVTGTVSDFIDIVYNLGSQSETPDDSILHSLKEFRKTAVFAGDQTWNRLYPEKMFKRSRPNIDSLFVNDFHEGDKNVTEFVKREITLNDWNLMLIHYLGLDHIGHVEGNASPKIHTKLREMDKVISDIVLSSNFSNKMLIVTGDHGMKNGGGHGGNDPEELFVPLLMFKSGCYLRKEPKIEPIIDYEKLTFYKQIDLAPTLSAVMGLEIPTESVGALIPEMLAHYPYQGQLYYYFRNSQHLLHLLLDKISYNKIREQNYFHWFQMALQSHEKYLNDLQRHNISSMTLYEKARQNYLRINQELSNILSRKSGSFRYDMIVIGLILSILCILNLLLGFFNDIRNPFIVGFIKSMQSRIFFWIFMAFIATTIIYYTDCIEFNSLWDVIGATIGVGAIFILTTNLVVNLISIFMAKKKILLNSERLQMMPWTFAFIFVCRTMTLGSSSFIEEEHLVWYYLTVTLYLLLIGQNIFMSITQRLQNAVTTLLQPNIDDSSATDNVIIHPKRKKLQCFNLLIQNYRQICVVFLTLLIILIAQNWNGAGVRWYDRLSMKQFFEKANKIYLQMIFCFGLILLYWQLNRCPKHTLSLWQSFITGLALFNAFFYRKLMWRMEYQNMIDKNSTKYNNTANKEEAVNYSLFTNYVLFAFWSCVALMALSQCNGLMRKMICLFNTQSEGNEEKRTPYSFPQNLYTKFTTLMIIFALLQSPHSVILLPCLIYTLERGYRLCDSLYFKQITTSKYQLYQQWLMKTVLTVFVGEMFYYCQGNSNRLSTINLNPGYIGLSSYNPIIVGTLITLHLYTAPIAAFWYLMWHLAHFLAHFEDVDDAILEKSVDLDDRNDIICLVMKTYILIIILPVAFYWLLLLGFRYHLFIYSVFAPKAMYSCFHLMVIFINFIIVSIYYLIYNSNTSITKT